MKRRNRGLMGKIGICMLMFSFILLPISSSICMADQATHSNAGGGAAGQGAALGLSALAVVGIAAGVILAIVAIAAATDDEEIPPVAPAHH